MKKKLMMVAVFLGTLSLGACVDDNESASVTNVRNAKAEQLKAVAAYNNAQAEAALITANAEKAVKEAEAAYKLLENELKDIELQQAKAALEMNIEAAKARAEAELESAKASLEAAKASMIAALDKVNNAEKQRIQQLLNEANTVLSKLQAARNSKLNATAQIAKLNAELESASEYVASERKRHENEIARQEALIAQYEGLESSKTDALQAYHKAYAEQQALQEVADEKEARYNRAYQDLLKKATNKRQYDFYKKASMSNYYKSTDIFAEDEDENPAYHKVEYTYATGITESKTWDIQLVNYELDQEAVDLAKKGLPELILDAKAEIRIKDIALKEAQEAYNKVMKSEAYTAAKKAVTDAQKAYNEAKTAEDIETTKEALKEAQAALEAFGADEKEALEEAQFDKEVAEETLKTYEEQLADIEEAEALINSEAAAAYAEYVEAYKAAFEACSAAYFEYQKADKAAKEQEVVSESLKAVADGAADYESLISECKQTISEEKAAMEELTAVETKEEAIRAEEEKLDKATSDIAIYEKQYADYMAVIKGAIAE